LGQAVEEATRCPKTRKAAEQRTGTMAKPRRKEKAAPDETGWEENRKPKRPRRCRLNGYQRRCTDRRCSLHEVWRQMARGIGGAHRSKPRPPRSSISKTKAQPTGMRTTR